MRCLSIARACAKLGAEVTFLVSDEESLALLQERFDRADEFGVHCLHSDYRRMTEEVPELTTYLEQCVAVLPEASDATATESAPSPVCSAPTQSTKPWLFVDSYFATPAYFAALRSHCRVAYLDDLRSFPCDVDLVINYDTDDDCPFYTNAKRKLLGAAYTPLREQFAKPAYEVRPAVRSILLSTGGTDPYNVAERILTRIFDAEDSTAAPAAQSGTPSDACTLDPAANTAADLRALQTCDCHVVTSSANSHYDRLLALAKDNPQLHIHSGVKDMAALMADCDLAVSAGGTTLCELCAIGVPAISYLMAENQRTAVETFAARELIPYAGDIRGERVDSPGSTQAFSDSSLAKALPPVNPSTLDNILMFLTHMSQNVEARKKSSHAMRAFLDGLGAERIAKALLS
jgi:spore coat polysaccharide biosynthesis predicted glycosyltransferase SpsG